MLYQSLLLLLAFVIDMFRRRIVPFPPPDSVYPMERNDVDDPSPTLVQDLERRTMRSLSMETSFEDNISKCHLQTQSILYRLLPKEIRDLIFAFATAPFEDLENEYGVNERYYRPGYRAPRKTCTNLLLTCRRIWLETNALPMRQAVHSFWHHKGPRKETQKEASLSNMTTLNKQSLTTVQLFMQLYEAETMADDPYSLDRYMYWLSPKVLRITIRHSDWWDWEQYKPLELRNDTWVQNMLDQANRRGIEQVELELETLTTLQAQLIPIVNKVIQLRSSPRLLKSKFARQVGDSSSEKTSTELRLIVDDHPKTWNWIGSAELEGELQSVPHCGLAQLDYHVQVVTWRSKRELVDAPAESHSELPPPSPERLYPFHRPRGFPRFRRGPRRHLPLFRPPPVENPELCEQVQRNDWQDFPFPMAQYQVRQQSREAAQRLEDLRRKYFGQMFADLAARDLRTQWDEQGSLLKFDGQ